MVRDEADRAARATGASVRIANRRARLAAHVATIDQDEASDPDPELTEIPAVDASGSLIPVPSRHLKDYLDGEGDRQLAWNRYMAGLQRGLDVQTKLRERIRIEEVQDWCGRVMVVINRRLPALQGIADQMPTITDEQKEWLRKRLVEWDRTYREELSREVIQ